MNVGIGGGLNVGTGTENEVGIVTVGIGKGGRVGMVMGGMETPVGKPVGSGNAGMVMVGVGMGKFRLSASASRFSESWSGRESAALAKRVKRAWRGRSFIVGG